MSDRLLPFETIVKSQQGDPAAVNAVLARYAGYIKHFSRINGHYNVDMEEVLMLLMQQSFLPSLILMVDW